MTPKYTGPLTAERLSLTLGLLSTLQHETGICRVPHDKNTLMFMVGDVKSLATLIFTRDPITSEGSVVYTVYAAPTKDNVMYPVIEVLNILCNDSSLTKQQCLDQCKVINDEHYTYLREKGII